MLTTAFLSLALSLTLLPACDGATCPPVITDDTTITGRTTQDSTSDLGKGGDNHETSGQHDSKPSEQPCIPGRDPDCFGPVAPADDTTTKPAPTSTQLREVVAKLKLPDPTPRLGPDPSVNEWNMLAVGYPIWLWTDQPTHLTTTAHHDGLTFTLDAQLVSTTFTMGDGNTKTCTTTTPYPGLTRKTSPTCSYTYDTPSPIGHPYTLTAATGWNITWHTTGHHGTLVTDYTGTRTLEVGELQSLIVG